MSFALLKRIEELERRVDVLESQKLERVEALESRFDTILKRWRPKNDYVPPELAVTRAPQLK